MSIFRRTIILGFLISVAGSFSALAADPEDAPIGASAEILQAKIDEEVSGELLGSDLPKEVIIEDEKPDEITGEKAVTFELQKIHLDGDNLIDINELRPILEKYEKRKVSFRELQSLTRKIERYYRTQGYFITAFIPPQKMEVGELTINLLAARMGQVKVEGNRYFRKSKIKSYWTIPEGRILKYSKLQDILTDLNQNPDRVVKPVLTAGEVQGTTDVLLNVEDKFPIHIGYSFDNGGVKLTGRERHGFTVRSNNMLGLDDIFIIGTVFGESFGALYLQHLLPLTNFGSRLISKFSHAQTNPKKEFERFGINGISQNYGLQLRQRLYRSKRWQVEGYAGFDFKEKKTRVLSVTTTRDRLRVLSWGLSGSLRDKRGAWVFGQDFTTGFSPQGDGFVLNSRGGETSYFKYGFSLQRSQKLPWKTRGILKMRGQLSDNRLVPQEQLNLGGSSTVRGYPESDFLGDQGIIVNAEHIIPIMFLPEEWKVPLDSSPLKERLNAFWFVDYGYARNNQPSATDRKTRNMMGVGGGAEWRFRKNFSARIEWGVPILDRPITESGKSQVYFRIKTDL